MARYLTTTDVAERLRRNYETLYNRDGAVDTDLVDADIDAAEAIVETAIGARYTLPVSDANSLRLVKAWSLTLVEELAYGAVPGRKVPENVERRIERVYKLLDRVQSGDYDLPAGADAEDERTDAVTCVQTADPEFTRDNMKGF